MGLNYLQKKNWHPGSLKNQEIVWIREQIQAEIIKREQERAKKLAEEKNIEELKRIQVEAGLIPKSHLDRMEWMYDVSKLEKQNQKSAEEYLLGKTATSQEVEKMANSRDKAKQIQQQQYQTIFKEETTNAKCEEFVLLHEDPFFQIMKGEQNIKQSLLQNPLKVKQLHDQLQSLKKIKKEKKKDKEKKEKSSKKDKKSKKKSKKEKKHSRSSSSSRSSSLNQEISTGNSTASAHSQFLQQYVKKSLGNIAVQDENGNIKADFSLMKKKYRNNLNKDAQVNQLREQMELDGKQRIQSQLQKEEHVESSPGSGKFLHQMRQEIYTQGANTGHHDRIHRNKHFQERLRD